MNRRAPLVTAACLSLCLVGLWADPVRSFEAARDSQAREDWYGAIEGYQEALRDNPSFNEAYKGLAESFYALEEYGQANDQITKALAFRKNDPALLNLKGFILIGLGKIDEASEAFRNVLSIWPNDVHARFGLAEIELYSGKITSAAGYYAEALRRNPENRKALLSLALVSRESGNLLAARDYITKALQFHGDNPQVFYFAGYLASIDGLHEEAERHIRNALTLKPDYDAASELLAALLFRTGRYTEVISVCDERIAKDRNRVSAWYLKTIALERLGRHEDALVASRAGLQVSDGDDILRAAMERIVTDNLKFEDQRRSSWASWHVAKAAQFERSNMSDQALYEYRRALKINPDDAQVRQAYAKLLLTRGYPGRYLSQLEFIQSLGKSATQINDAVESYSRLLSGSVAKKWGIEPLYLDKSHVKIGLYYMMDGSNIIHPDSERITTAMIGDAFSHDLRLSVRANEQPVGSYSEAFRVSRQAGEDYFALVTFGENKRDIQITLDMYVSRTGSRADTFNVFRTGNDRYPNALRRLAQMVGAAMPVRGAIVARYQGDAVIDLGKSDGISAGQSFDIIEASQVSPLNEGIGIQYDPQRVLGTFTVTTLDEDVSQGKIERGGFFDRINKGDSVILRKTEGDKDGKKEGEKSPEQESAGESGGRAGKTAEPAKTDAGTVSKAPRMAPALLGLIRKITG